MRSFLKLLFVVSLILGFAGPAAAGGLVDMLVSNLDVTPKQAEGGAGAIFGVAKDSMSADDFLKVTDAMPEVTDLMGAAPEAKSSSGAVGQVTNMLGGGKSGGLGNMATLAGAFSSLDMDAGMVSKFIPIVLEYAQDKGGDMVSGLLSSALK